MPGDGSVRPDLQQLADQGLDAFMLSTRYAIAYARIDSCLMHESYDTLYDFRGIFVRLAHGTILSGNGASSIP